MTSERNDTPKGAPMAPLCKVELSIYLDKPTLKCDLEAPHPQSPHSYSHARFQVIWND